MVCDFKEEMLLVATEVSLESQSVQPVLMPRPLSFVMRSHRHSSWKGLVLMCTRCPCVHAAPRRRSTSRIHEHSRLQKGGFCTGLGRGTPVIPWAWLGASSRAHHAGSFALSSLGNEED